MSKPTFCQLFSTLSPSFPPTLPPDSSLAAALFRLAHGASYKFLARRFGFSSSADACNAFYTVCKLINDKLGNALDFQTDISRIVVGFGWISLPNCCGVLGLGRFEVDGQLMGSNGSVLVQALVDSEGRFLDISAGWPSTIKPESILHKTKLFSRVEESRELLNGPCYNLSDGYSVPQYILGDSCFPLLPWLITPYERSNEEGDSFSSPEKEFNAVHSRAMGLVKTAFGRVKARWQLLSKKWKEGSVEFMPFVIVMGCLLHNFLIKCSEPLPEEHVEDSREDQDELMPVSEEEADESGQRIRDAIALHLNRVSLRK
ncbi:Harbinger transposase-derived nuclease [Corchorus olitorius]|uniref:Harbinger transposase-derived nuclease n=1 Tax=Corchorus olitorius TaxID=93759 RepID=A0A1R3ICN8_9ROSI|nr:Harbinger transposase-derived nuclease [Corchorus olitorius]